MDKDKEEYAGLLVNYQRLKGRIRAARYEGEESGIPVREGITATIAPSVHNLRMRNLQNIPDDEKVENERKIAEIVKNRKMLQANLEENMVQLIQRILTCNYMKRYGTSNTSLYEYQLKNYLV